MRPENIVVTLKTEKPGGLWPLIRGTFARIGFGVVVVAGVSLMDTPNPSLERAGEALREGLEAYQIKTDTPQHAYSKAPTGDPEAGVVHVLVPRPASETGRVCFRYDDHYNPEACALLGDPANASGSSR
jgi:hypothetical protein